MAVDMAASHSSRSDAELQREKTSMVKQRRPLEIRRFLSLWSLPRRQDKGSLHALNVQLVLIGLLGWFANLQSIS